MKQVDGGIVLFDTIYIGNGEAPLGTLLNLRVNPGEPMTYNSDNRYTIDFPGEYELAGYRILAFAKPNSLLISYIISFQNHKVAYIQDKAVLEEDNMGDMDTRYITDEKIEKSIEKRELEGEIVLVE